MTRRPFVQELAPPPDVSDAFRRLSDWKGVVLLDSARFDPQLGRYSFLAAEPTASFETRRAEYGVDPFRSAAKFLAENRSEMLVGLPPFQGGLAGILCYELGGCWERLPAPASNEFDLPVAVLNVYNWVLAWDHLQNRCWFISQGGDEMRPAAESWSRVRDALSRGRSNADMPRPPRTHPSQSPGDLIAPISIETVSHEVESGSSLVSNFSREAYLAAVERVIDLIYAGDIFQANVSQRLLFPASRTPIDQYLQLRAENPAPFAGYFAHDDWAVMSSSPERFLKLVGNDVSTRPIKGTRKRRETPEADLFTRDELRESGKDHAENVMIVDLLRNDLSRVCRAGTIHVPELCSVEAYATVTHLVSEVRGQLREGRMFWDLIAAAFPGGSITGAPKIRAMEVITEVERVARGPYCGSLFYCGFDGTADSNILIRTMTSRGGWLQMPVGGGIVAESDPGQEYAETLHKAEGMIHSLDCNRIG